MPVPQYLKKEDKVHPRLHLAATLSQEKWKGRVMIGEDRRRRAKEEREDMRKKEKKNSQVLVIIVKSSSSYTLNIFTYVRGLSYFGLYALRTLSTL